MIRNYTRTATRSLLKYKGYTVINVIGLVLGIAGCLLMLMYIQYEFSYDGFHEKKDRIYRLGDNMEYGGNVSKTATTPSPWGPALLADYPGIESMTRLRRFGSRYTMRYEDRSFYQREVLFAESSLFDIFTFPLIKGNPSTVLTQPYSVVISESIAELYFGEADPIGSTITVVDSYSLTVTGVMRDLPANCHFHFDILISFPTLAALRLGEPATFKNHGFDYSVHTYLLMRDGYLPEDLEAQLPFFIERYLGDQMRAAGIKSDPNLQSINDIHLYSQNVVASLKDNGDIRSVYIAFSLAVFILIIACINFINLATARSVHRAREVGVRKVLGGSHMHVILHFMCESVLLSLFSLVLAIALLQTVLPFFNDLFSKEITLGLSLHSVPALIGIALLVGILAGIYPALVLADFKSTQVLHGSLKVGSGDPGLRKTLVVIQFIISIVMVSVTVVIFDQLNYMLEEDLGFEKENVIVTELPLGDVMFTNNDTPRRYELLRERTLRYPDVLGMSLFSSLPGISQHTGPIRVVGAPETQKVRTILINADHDFQEVIGIQLVQGRFFSRDRSTDETACVVNESAVRALGVETALDRSIVGPFGRTCRIIGVARDFNWVSLHQKNMPIRITLAYPGQLKTQLAIKVAGQRQQETVGYVGNQWEKAYLEQPVMEHSFLNEIVEAQYKNEQLLGNVFSVGTMISVLIACLGLVGLSTFMVENRIREIGIRKVVGATVTQVVLVLYREFTLSVLIAFGIGTLISIYVVELWLRDFAFRIDINPWTYVLTGVLVILITWFTVLFQTVRAARTNPVDVLI